MYTFPAGILYPAVISWIVSGTSLIITIGCPKEDMSQICYFNLLHFKQLLKNSLPFKFARIKSAQSKISRQFGLNGLNESKAKLKILPQFNRFC